MIFSTNSIFVFQKSQSLLEISAFIPFLSLKTDLFIPNNYELTLQYLNPNASLVS